MNGLPDHDIDSGAQDRATPAPEFVLVAAQQSVGGRLQLDPEVDSPIGALRADQHPNRSQKYSRLLMEEMPLRRTPADGVESLSDPPTSSGPTAKAQKIPTYVQLEEPSPATKAPQMDQDVTFRKLVHVPVPESLDKGRTGERARSAATQQATTNAAAAAKEFTEPQNGTVSEPLAPKPCTETAQEDAISPYQISPASSLTELDSSDRVASPEEDDNSSKAPSPVEPPTHSMDNNDNVLQSSFGTTDSAGHIPNELKVTSNSAGSIHDCLRLTVEEATHLDLIPPVEQHNLRIVLAAQGTQQSTRPSMPLQISAAPHTSTQTYAHWGQSITLDTKWNEEDAVGVTLVDDFKDEIKALGGGEVLLENIPVNEGPVTVHVPLWEHYDAQGRRMKLAGCARLTFTL